MKDFWYNFLGRDRELMQRISESDVKALESTAPGACRTDWQMLKGKVESGQIFGNFSKPIQDRLWTEMCSHSTDRLIPSFATFFDDTNWFKGPADSLRWLTYLSPHQTLYSALEDMFSDVNQTAGQCVVQHSDTDYTTCPGRTQDRLELGMRQLFMFAMRHHLEIPRPCKKKNLLAKSREKEADKIVLRKFADLAYRLGFESDEIRSLMQTQSQLLTPEHSDTGDLEESDLIPRRCGIPFEAHHEQDKPSLFLERLHAGRDEGCESMTSFFVRRSVYFAFCGGQISGRVGSGMAVQRPTIVNQDPATQGNETGIVREQNIQQPDILNSVTQIGENVQVFETEAVSASDSQDERDQGRSPMSLISNGEDQEQPLSQTDEYAQQLEQEEQTSDRADQRLLEITEQAVLEQTGQAPSEAAEPVQLEQTDHAPSEPERQARLENVEEMQSVQTGPTVLEIIEGIRSERTEHTPSEPMEQDRSENVEQMQPEQIEQTASISLEAEQIEHASSVPVELVHADQTEHEFSEPAEHLRLEDVQQTIPSLAGIEEKQDIAGDGISAEEERAMFESTNQEGTRIDEEAELFEDEATSLEADQNESVQAGPTTSIRPQQTTSPGDEDTSLGQARHMAMHPQADTEQRRRKHSETEDGKSHPRRKAPWTADPKRVTQIDFGSMGTIDSHQLELEKAVPEDNEGNSTEPVSSAPAAGVRRKAVAESGREGQTRAKNLKTHAREKMTLAEIAQKRREVKKMKRQGRRELEQNVNEHEHEVFVAGNGTMSIGVGESSESRSGESPQTKTKVTVPLMHFYPSAWTCLTDLE